MNKLPLIAHVVYALRAGGLENGLINLINSLPADKFRHVVICVTDFDDFAKRIQRDDVEIHCIHKREGKDLGWYVRLWRLLRQLKPDIVHSRNLATIESQLVATLAGVRGHVHGEHGWDMYDLGGANNKYRWLRKILVPFIQRFIPLSQEIEHYLKFRVHVPARKIKRICNGVDVQRFFAGQPESDDDKIVIGYIGRLQPVKDPLNLVDAFIDVIAQRPELKSRLQLSLVGGGPLQQEATDRLKDAGLLDQCWLPGHCDNIAEQLRGFDIFVLPSKAEGISNTILEAMASGLPVVATDVGGNSELLLEGENAMLVPPSDSKALAEAILIYVDSSNLRQLHGRCSRSRAEQYFSLERMVADYQAVYEGLLGS